MKRKKERRLFYDSADTISDDVYIKFLALSAPWKYDIKWKYVSWQYLIFAWI